MRMNIPNADRSCDTARSFLPPVITSTGRFIATRLLRRRTHSRSSAFPRRSQLVRDVPADCRRLTYGSARWRGSRSQDVSVGLGGRDVVRGVSAEVAEGELVVIVGPNGAGKTTLLRAIAGLVPARAGTRAGDGPRSGARRAPGDRARPRLPAAAVRARVSVRRRGGRAARALRAASAGSGSRASADLAAARAAMKACDVAALATRRFDELSGGEARRVIVAQALCQGAQCLLLDEPTAGLDPAHARGVFEMLRAQCDAGASRDRRHPRSRSRAAPRPRDVAGRRRPARRRAARPATCSPRRRPARRSGSTIHVGELPSRRAVRGARVSGFVSGRSRAADRRGGS